jgi:hypothetical protein
LIAKRFHYFGGSGPRLLNHLNTLKVGRGRKNRFSEKVAWLNHVELWFAKIERDLIARGIFKSQQDLKRKIMRHIRQYNKSAKPVKWKYADPQHRITPLLPVTVH